MHKRTSFEVLQGLTLSELSTVLLSYASALRHGARLDWHVRCRLVKLAHQASIVLSAKVGG